MKRFREHLNENFASKLTRLSTQDISKITKDKIEFSRFIKLDKSSDAIYGIVMKDDNEGTYIATKVTINAYVGGRYEFEWDPVPTAEDDDKHKMIELVKKWK